MHVRIKFMPKGEIKVVEAQEARPRRVLYGSSGFAEEAGPPRFLPIPGWRIEEISGEGFDYTAYPDR